jgi:alkylhydroperoxidase/carboxymuconolactone decarboxylase family protein YurZ
MATIQLLEESEATGRIKTLYEEIKSTLQIPFVPQLFLALGRRPEQLETVWKQVRGLYAEGHLDVKTKLFAALAVAAAAPSPYFVSIHSAALKRLGVGDDLLGELLEVAALSDSLKTLVSGLGLEPEL